MHKKTSKLGRGLSSLFGDDQMSNIHESIQLIDLNKIEANPGQPRKYFNEEKLSELVESIKSRGVINPILLQETEKEKYKIIAGERRYRASKKLGLLNIPAIVKKISEKELMEFALIENIQRDDLNPVEEALAYKVLSETYKYTQKELASSLGKSRSYIANLSRILSLPDEIKEMLQKGELTLGHTKIMVGKENALVVAKKIVKEGLSVRQAEELLSGKKTGKSLKPKSPVLLSSEDLQSLENIMSEKLDFTVRIKAKNNHSGDVLLKFKDFQELDQILQFLNTKN